jgi:glycosyltransferase involved in cell wall biosynthesis
VLQAGGALTSAFAVRARREMRNNPRYRWLGELPRAGARALIARSRLLVLSSRMEGGANVVSEALALATPIVASRIDGTVGQLGRDYPGYFEVGDSRGLSALLLRSEREPSFFRELGRCCARLAPRFSPEQERAALAALMRELMREP